MGEVENIYKKIRRKYGLSKASMSKVLGFGVNQWRRYERGEIEPKDSHSLLIRLIMDPKSFLKMIDDNSGVLVRELGEAKHSRLRGRINELLHQYMRQEKRGYQEWVESLYR